MTKEEYNAIPVHYCKNCLSLAIVEGEIPGSEFCRDCGHTEVGMASIEAWEMMYVSTNGKKLISYGRK